MYKPVPNTKYTEVNELGQFRTREHTTVLKSGYEKFYPVRELKLSQGAYLTINLTRGDRRGIYKAHRLVWEAFNGPLQSGDMVVFKTNDRSNIALNNLELKTRKQDENDYQLLLRLESLGMSHEDLAKKFNTTELLISRKCANLRRKDNKHLLNSFQKGNR